TISNIFVVVFQESFTDVQAAVAFFSDDVLDLGIIQPEEVFGFRFLTAELKVEITATNHRAGDSFRFDVVTAAVPEPSAMTLVLVGAIVVVGTRICRRWLL
ncbi:MAG: hypothetical protein M3032_03210, partial [Verrucomicrobiota bacterium]|nr:hypothetical protein [Verrucomicrobiota bacterium]